MTGFLILKWIHVLSAIVAVGSNITYAVWARLAQKQPANLAFVLRGIKFLDDRVANPAYGLLLVTGLVMAFTQYSIGTRWIVTGLILYVVMATLAITVITPGLKRQIDELDRGGPTSPAYISAAARVRGVGMFLGVLAVAVVFVMVFKPTL